MTYPAKESWQTDEGYNQTKMQHQKRLRFALYGVKDAMTCIEDNLFPTMKQRSKMIVDLMSVRDELCETLNLPKEWEL